MVLSFICVLFIISVFLGIVVMIIGVFGSGVVLGVGVILVWCSGKCVVSLGKGVMLVFVVVIGVVWIGEVLLMDEDG